jgi:DNA invertase Pin-like site-specific DNA recombinase
LSLLFGLDFQKVPPTPTSKKPVKPALADRNHVDPFILHLFAALAEKERAMIATRTKAALAAAKARGVKLGGPKLAEAREAAIASLKALADRNASNVLPIIREIQRTGAASLHQIADALNARGISTPRGGKWYAKSVSNLLART